MECGFCGGQSKDQPSVAGIDGRKAKHVAKEDAIRFRILAVEDDVSSRNHDAIQSSPAAYSIDAVM
jgi:hypothetical protein